MTDTERKNRNSYFRSYYKKNRLKIRRRSNETRDYKKEIEYLRKRRKQIPELNSWHNMKARCYRKNHSAYKYYGRRGIKILYKSFAEFISNVGRKPGALYSIDRINNNGHYKIGNCRWATRKQQMHNTRRNKNDRYKRKD